MDDWIKCEHCGRETSPRNLACLWCGLWRGYDYSTYPATQRPQMPAEGKSEVQK